MWNWIAAAQEAESDGRPAAIVTVVRTWGSTPRGVGAKMIVSGNGSIKGTIGGGQLERLAITDALKCVRTGQSGIFSYPLTVESGQCCGGKVELFMDVLNVQPSISIFGAGHVGQALCSTLEGTVFAVNLVDDRTEWLNQPGLPDSVRRHEAGWRSYIEKCPWDASSSYALIVTPSHADDMEILRTLIHKPLRYLGLIGSRAKWKQFRSTLGDAGFQQVLLDKVRCPVGIGRTGQAPREIAISIAAEILMDYYGTASDSANPAGSRPIE